ADYRRFVPEPCTPVRPRTMKGPCGGLPPGVHYDGRVRSEGRAVCPSVGGVLHRSVGPPGPDRGLTVCPAPRPATRNPSGKTFQLGVHALQLGLQALQLGVDALQLGLEPRVRDRTDLRAGSAGFRVLQLSGASRPVMIGRTQRGASAGSARIV